MKQRYCEIDKELCKQAVKNFFKGKWHRNDVSCVIEEYAGIKRRDIAKESFIGKETTLKDEAIECIACETLNRLERLREGDDDALELDDIVFRLVPDGMNGKIREIAYCCIFHQIFNHILVLALMPLFSAKILPTQYASIPHKGQTGLKKHVMKKFRKKKLAIKTCKKTDVKKAYPSTMYSVIIKMVEKEIPSATLHIKLLKALAQKSPKGCLIIGGYLDAWLFNFLMSYALRYALSLRKVKRGESVKLVKDVVAFMDDFDFMGSREKDVEKTIKAIDKYISSNFGLSLKMGAKTKLLSFEEEKARRNDRPSVKSGRYTDVGGYQMHHGYITIRKKIFVRLRRTYLRAMRFIKKYGYLCLQIAHRVNAYFGYLTNSSSKYVREKYHTDWLHNIAREVVSHYAKLENEMKRRIYNVSH